MRHLICCSREKFLFILLERTGGPKQSIEYRWQLHIRVCQLGSNRAIIWATKRRNSQRSSAVHDGRCWSGNQRNPRTSEVSDRDSCESFQSKWKVLVFPKKVFDTAVLPESERGEWLTDSIAHLHCWSLYLMAISTSVAIVYVG